MRGSERLNFRKVLVVSSYPFSGENVAKLARSWPVRPVNTRFLFVALFDWIGAVATVNLAARMAQPVNLHPQSAGEDFRGGSEV